MNDKIIWDQATLDANGGHSPECEQFCDASCPIGQARKAEAERRFAWGAAQRADARVADVLTR